MFGVDRFYFGYFVIGFLKFFILGFFFFWIIDRYFFDSFLGSEIFGWIRIYYELFRSWFDLYLGK